ncbi:hypothetical protein JTB14_031099 [Gonioctena quinquepunctata]|nr:hypothetical protein JTB14_031099 [Gonioctena quinquepunctata]
MIEDIEKLGIYSEKYNPNRVPSKCDDIILEAKRVLLNEQLEKIANFTLSTVHKQCSTHIEKFPKGYKDIDWKNESFWKDLPNPKMEISKEQSLARTDNHPENETVHILIDDLLQTSTSGATNTNKSFLLNYSNKQNICKKYFNLWREVVEIKKEKVNIIESKINQADKLNNFIRKLKKRKKSEKNNKHETVEILKEESADNPVKYVMNYPKPSSNYKNRFNAQKAIIELQKAKLERQNEIIEDLKLGIIQEDLLNSIENTKTNIREIFSDCSEKIKCSENRATNGKKSSGEGTKPRDYFEKETVNEEKRQRLLEEAIEKKKALEEEEKKRQLDMMKERRKKELEQEKIRQANKQRYMDNMNRAIEFHNGILVEQCFKKLKINLQKSKERYLLACQHYERTLLKRSFGNWIFDVESSYILKYEIADAHFEYKILKRVIQIWREVCVESTRNTQVAEDLYDFRLTSNTFIHWHRYVCTEIMSQDKNIKKAAKHYARRILFHYFYQWRSLKAVNQLEKAKEQKKRKWREKVWEILPNYKPPTDLYE